MNICCLGKNKDATTVIDWAYHNSDEYEDEISDSSKQVETSKDPITDNHVCNTSVGTTSVNPAVISVGIIGRGGHDGMINRGTGIISSNIVTYVLTDSGKMILRTDTFPLNPFKSQTLVIALQNEPTLICNRIIRASSEIGNSRIYQARIGTLITNKNIWSVNDNFSVHSDVDEANKLDTSVQ